MNEFNHSVRLIRHPLGSYFFDPETLQVFKLDSRDPRIRMLTDESDFLPAGMFETELSQVKENLCYSPNRTKRRKKGLYIILCLTDQCNLACQYCYRNLSPSKMTLETAKEIISKLMTMKLPGVEDKELYIIFFGGEPLLNMEVLKQFTNAIPSAFPKHNIHYSISTNGTLLTKSVLEFFDSHDFNVQFSIDGHKEIHDQQRPFINGRGSYDTIINNLRAVDFNKNNVSVRMTISKEYPRFFENLSHFLDIGFKRVALGFVLESGGERYDLDEESIRIIKSEIAKAYAFFLEHLSNGKFNYINPLYEHLMNIAMQATHYRCGATENVLSFNTNGDIYPCQRFLGNKEYCYGDAVQGIDEEKLLNIKALESFQINSSDCDTCWVRNLCSGKCYYQRTVLTSERESATRCALDRTMIEEALKCYISMRSRDISLINSVLAFRQSNN